MWLFLIIRSQHVQVKREIDHTYSMQDQWWALLASCDDRDERDVSHLQEHYVCYAENQV